MLDRGKGKREKRRGKESVFNRSCESNEHDERRGMARTGLQSFQSRSINWALEIDYHFKTHILEHAHNL